MTKRKEQAAIEPEEKAPEAVISFEDFLSTHTVNPGLVASFKVEASQVEGGLLPKTEAEWIHALEEQSNRTY